MKWPEQMILIRHDVSAYNELKTRKEKSPLYRQFVLAFEKDPTSEECIALARVVHSTFRLDVSDSRTHLIDPCARRAKEVGVALRKRFEDGMPPDVIFVSPYLRTKCTLEGLIRGWPALANVPQVEDERIREQEHGLATLYNDWRVFQVLHPEQRLLYKFEGRYRYRYPQGESVPDVRERNRSWINTVVRDFVGKRVLAVTHHLNILALRANLERWGEDKFIEVDAEDKPINCGVTIYRGDPNLGKDGRFVLDCYNACLFKTPID